MSNTIGSYPTLAASVLTQEELRHLRAICDEHKFGYDVFSAMIVKDVLRSEAAIETYISKVQQFMEDKQPANLSEVRALREKLRQQEEELEVLRQFKESLNSTKAPYSYK